MIMEGVMDQASFRVDPWLASLLSENYKLVRTSHSHRWRMLGRPAPKM